MITEKLSYHKAAGKFITTYYETNAANTLSFSCRFISGLAYAAKKIAKSLHLEEMDYQNAIVAVWFRFAGATEMGVGRTEAMKQLMNDFFTETNYPEEDRSVVEEAIDIAIENKYPGTKVQQVVCDAINSLLADPQLLQNIILMKEEMNALNGVDRVELFYLDHFLSLFVKTRYYTEYANENYSPGREKNFQLLEKRIRRAGDIAKATERLNGQLHHGSQLTNKETEDLFKIAFRNYNQLISVADAKASLLINVNSIIISVMLAFVLSKVEKNTFLLWPAILLLSVCMMTILLSILASRPQKNSLVEDKTSQSYQRFFFGSFDLIDPSFRSANWEEYYKQLNELFNNSKEAVYMEIYKESYNVRKVLSKKFNYLSKAYWVFIIGLLLSVIAFVVAIQSQTITP
jgi:hypothetical protein